MTCVNYYTIDQSARSYHTKVNSQRGGGGAAAVRLGAGKRSYRNETILTFEYGSLFVTTREEPACLC